MDDKLDKGAIYRRFCSTCTEKTLLSKLLKPLETSKQDKQFILYNMQPPCYWLI